MKITCSNCSKDMKLKAKTIEFISNAQKKGKTFIMLSCHNCGLDFGYNPQEENSNFEEELVWHCPTSGCHGYVSFINHDADDQFYGCGETGDIWQEEEEFYKDIEAIIKKYTYRSKCYKHENNKWLPSDIEPENLDKLIDQEEDDRFNRG